MNRPKRSNAGKNIQKLLNEEFGKEDDIDYFKNLYGGFEEQEEDKDFGNISASSDSFDSDFESSSRNEEKEEEYKYVPEEKNRPKKKKNVKADVKTEMKSFFDNFHNLRQENKTNPYLSAKMTQKELLKEAKNTRIANIASVKAYKLLENSNEENAKKLGKKRVFKKFQKPFIRTVSSNKEPNYLQIVTDSNEKIELFKPSRVLKEESCYITGKPANYIDPLTNQPFSDVDSFKKIREIVVKKE